MESKGEVGRGKKVGTSITEEQMRLMDKAIKTNKHPQLPTIDQLTDAETFAAASFFREVKKLDRELRKGKAMTMMGLIPVKRALRYWIEAVAERDAGVTRRTREMMEEGGSE